jgi:hypothetical protein
MADHETVVLWTDGEWRCDYHPGYGGAGRLEVYRADQLVTVEGALSISLAQHRGEVLRQRVLRGDLRADN